MARVFLSHAKADRVEARRIAEALRRAGHEPWIAEDEIHAGEAVPAAIVRGLQSTDDVVVCLSRSAITSGWVAGELDLFVLREFEDRMARVLLVRLDAVEAPGLVRHLQVVDLYPGSEMFERGVQRILRSIDRRGDPSRKGHVAVRLDEPTLARLDALLGLYALPGRGATRSDALRGVILAGIDTEERRAARRSGATAVEGAVTAGAAPEGLPVAPEMVARDAQRPPRAIDRSSRRGHVAVRLDEPTIARLDALLGLYALPGRGATRSDALRGVILAGIDTEERRAARLETAATRPSGGAATVKTAWAAPPPAAPDESLAAPVELQAAPFPPNNLPPRRLFVGHEAELARLDAALARPGGRASIVGPAGAGKTALALAYAYHAGRRGMYPGGIWWLAAAGPPDQMLSGLAAPLRANAGSAVRDRLAKLPPEASADERAGAVRRALEDDSKASLVVLDGAHPPGWTPEGPVRVLTTSRDAKVADGARIELTRLPDAAIDHALEKAVQAAEELEPAVHENRGRVDHTNATVTLERALPIFERAEDHARAAVAAYRLGELHGREGGWETARRLFERGLELAKRADVPVLVAEGYRLIADAALHGLDYENAQLCYEEAIRRWDALDRPREAADARLLLVTLLLQLGRGRGGARHVVWLRAHLARPELSPEARREIEDVLRLASAADAQERPDGETAT